MGDYFSEVYGCSVDASHLRLTKVMSRIPINALLINNRCKVEMLTQIILNAQKCNTLPYRNIIKGNKHLQRDQIADTSLTYLFL